MTLRRLQNSVWGFESSCFVCEPSNPAGLGIPFLHDDEADVVRARFMLDGRFSGAPSYLHGGIGLAVLDEAMAWATIAIGGRFATTAESGARFQRPLRVGHRYQVEARVAAHHGERLRTEATVTDEHGRVCIDARATFVVLTPERAPDAIGDVGEDDASYLGGGRGPQPHRRGEGRGVWEGGEEGKGPAMEEKKDDLKGRMKEAAGDLTDDEDLREGQLDQAAAKAKGKLGGAVDAVKDKFRKK